MMIKNERQYRITRKQAAKFEAALDRFREQARGDGSTHPRLLKAQQEALASQLASLQIGTLFLRP